MIYLCQLIGQSLLDTLQASQNFFFELAALDRQLDFPGSISPLDIFFNFGSLLHTHQILALVFKQIHYMDASEHVCPRRTKSVYLVGKQVILFLQMRVIRPLVRCTSNTIISIFFMLSISLDLYQNSLPYTKLD